MATAINTALVEELNDLVQIHNDRIRGYENAIEDVQEKNTDLRKVFQQMIDISLEHRTQLSDRIGLLGGEGAEGSTLSGKIYRAWMDIKLALSGLDRVTVLENCRHGEEAAQKAYDMALASNAEMPADILYMLSAQQQALRTQQQEIAAYEVQADKMK